MKGSNRKWDGEPLGSEVDLQARIPNGPLFIVGRPKLVDEDW